MVRGQFVTAVIPGDFGKPRPALVVQSNLFNLDTVAICPLTTHVRADVPQLRLDVPEGVETGLRLPSQIAIDKITSLRPHKFGPPIGVADAELMRRVDRALAVFLGLV